MKPNGIRKYVLLVCVLVTMPVMALMMALSDKRRLVQCPCEDCRYDNG